MLSLVLCNRRPHHQKICRDVATETNGGEDRNGLYIFSGSRNSLLLIRQEVNKSASLRQDAQKAIEFKFVGKGVCVICCRKRKMVSPSPSKSTNFPLQLLM